MDDDERPIEGKLSDGTHIGDVVAEMPVEVRESGSNEWRLAYVLWVDQITFFPRVWVEGPGRNQVSRYHTNYVRVYRKDRSE